MWRQAIRGRLGRRPDRDFQLAGLHRGVAFADFDNDGRIDAVVTCMNGPAKLFHNVTAAARTGWR